MLLKQGSRGTDVKKLQTKLGLTADGIFDSNTENAIKDWQKNHGLNPDGIVGDLTWGKLFEVGKFADLAPGDLDDDDNASDNTSDDDSGTSFAAIDGLDLNKLKGHIPDAVIAQIPECAAKFAINTRLRLAHFLAQCGHESGGFKFVVENLNYSADGLKKIFGKYFPGNLAQSYARQPQKIASHVYANRMGNGDEASQDGWNYRGRGYIQLTGKTNYQAFDKSIGEDILGNPDIVAQKYPLLSAAWFWDNSHLNTLADHGSGDDTVTAITKRVNGGTLGLADRISHFKEYYAALA